MKNEKGITLMENMAAILVITAALIPVATFFGRIFPGIASVSSSTKALSFACERILQTTNSPYGEIFTGLVEEGYGAMEEIGGEPLNEPRFRRTTVVTSTGEGLEGSAEEIEVPFIEGAVSKKTVRVEIAWGASDGSGSEENVAVYHLELYEWDAAVLEVN